MYRQKPYQLLGWKNIRVDWYETWKCPSCGHIKEILFGRDESAECHRCKKSFRFDDWPRAKYRRHHAVCAGCDVDTALTALNCSSYDSWFCTECNNLIALKWQHKFVSPTEILKFDWAPAVQQRAAKVGKGLRISDCRTKGEHLITWLLFHLGKDAEGAFIFGEWKGRHALLVMDGKKYLGYGPVLRQKNFDLTQNEIVRELCRSTSLETRKIIAKEWAPVLGISERDFLKIAGFRKV